MHDINSTSKGECLGSKTGATHYNAQFGLPDKGRSIKGWFFCYVICYDLWDGSLEMRKVRGLVTCCGQNCNRNQLPQHPKVSYKYITT